MLDFYRVPDSVQADQFIETQGDSFNSKQIHLGSLNLQEHLQLQKFFPAMNISYFEDSHIKLAQTQELMRACEDIIANFNTSQNGSSVPASLATLYSMLKTALSFNQGILTICD